MGQKDISLVRYFEDRGRYADLINGFVFKGEQVVSDNDVQEMDSRITGVFGKLKKRFVIQKYRDCVRKVVFGMGFAVIGIENQDKIHYGMPVRIMLEDAGEYDKQLRQIKRYHRNNRDLREDEFRPITRVPGAQSPGNTTFLVRVHVLEQLLFFIDHRP